MNRPIRIFRHAACEGPGYLAEVIERRGYTYEIIELDHDQALPPDLDDISALVFLGGRLTVHDDLPWLPDERALIQQAASAGVPMLGHGFGAQLIAQALGARIVRNPVRVIGWFPVEQRDNLIARDWLAGLPESLLVFQWHVHAFNDPYDSASLLKSPWNLNEGFIKDNVLALQFHLELTEAMIHTWIKVYADQIAQPVKEGTVEEKLSLNWEAVIQGRESICMDLEQKIADLHRTADVIYGRWLDLLE